MTEVRLSRSHTLGLAGALARAREAEAELRRHPTMRTWWEGHALRFSLAGSHGEVVIAESEVVLRIELSFFARPLRGLVQRKAAEALDCWLAS